MKKECGDAALPLNETEKNDGGKTPLKNKAGNGDGLPRTPTPFKNALAEMGKRRSESYVPPSPTRLDEDITEIMHKEQSADSMNESDLDVKKEKENEQPPEKRMKAFENSWESSDISLLETPVRIYILFKLIW